jgi:hypothetical protein
VNRVSKSIHDENGSLVQTIMNDKPEYLLESEEAGNRRADEASLCHPHGHIMSFAASCDQQM